jgi:hypothetical protein
MAEEEEEGNGEHVVNGYSPQAELERRMGGSVASADADDEDKALEIRHTLVRTEAPSPPFDVAPHKAKEEEREEHAGLDAIDIDNTVPMDEGLAVADSVMGDLPCAAVLPRDRAQGSTVPVAPDVASPSLVMDQGQQRRGNMYIRVKVAVPQALGPLQAHLLTSLQQQWAVVVATSTAQAEDA